MVGELDSCVFAYNETSGADEISNSRAPFETPLYYVKYPMKIFKLVHYIYFWFVYRASIITGVSGGLESWMRRSVGSYDELSAQSNRHYTSIVKPNF